MNMYKVINRFKDLQHGGRIYEIGERYPAGGKKLVKSRAEFLTKRHPVLGVAFLEEIEEKSTQKKETTEKNDGQ